MIRGKQTNLKGEKAFDAPDEQHRAPPPCWRCAQLSRRGCPETTAAFVGCYCADCPNTGSSGPANTNTVLKELHSGGLIELKLENSCSYKLNLSSHVVPPGSPCLGSAPAGCSPRPGCGRAPLPAAFVSGCTDHSERPGRSERRPSGSKDRFLSSFLLLFNDSSQS